MAILPGLGLLTDSTDPTGASLGGGYGSGGLLGGAFSNPLLNFGMGLLSQSGPSREPQSGFANVGKAFAYASQAQQEAMKNELIRQKMQEVAKQSAATKQWQDLITSGGVKLPENVDPRLFAAAVGADPEGTAKAYTASVFPDSAAKLAEAQLAATAAANFPAVEKARLENEATVELRGFEKQTQNRQIENAVEVDSIINRLDKSPIPVGSSASMLVKKFADPDGYITATPKSIVEGVAAWTGKTMSEADAKQWSHDWNRMVKLQSVFINDQRQLQSAQQANAGTGGRTTDFGLGFIEKSNISPYNDPNANREIIRDYIKKQLEGAQIRGWTLPSEEVGKKLLKQYETQLAPTEPGTLDPAGTVKAEPGLAQKAMGAGGAIYRSLFGDQGAAAPVAPGSVVAPGATTTEAPPGSGSPMLPGDNLGVQNGNFVSQPAAQPVTTTPQPGVPAKTPPPKVAINPRTNQQEKVWLRPAEGKRAIIGQMGPDAVGRTFIAMDPATGRPRVYEIEQKDIR